MSSSFIFDSEKKSEVYLGRTHAAESENHTAKLCIGIRQCNLDGDSQETVEVQVWLTVEQVAEVVKMFFWETISSSHIYKTFLQRLLHRRWKVMTSQLSQHTASMPGYDRITT